MKGERKEKVYIKVLKQLTSVIIAAVLAVFVFVVLNY